MSEFNQGLVLTGNHEYAIIDLDNCISDDKWRWPLFQLDLPVINERYQVYHDACEADLYQNSFVVRELAAKYKLLAFTARPESVRFKTQRWANRWRIPLNGLFMRPNNNHEGSIPLKRKMLLSLPHTANVRYAIDDRCDILGMYADEGVATCQRVFIHEPEIIHP